MKATWEKTEKNTGVLTVEVESEKVAEALDKAFKKIVRRINVPGFRKGKVPRPIFEAKFGVESLYQDAIDIILPEAYMNAVKETGIEPIDRPEIDVQEFGKGQEFKFTAKVQVKPEVTLGAYKGLEVPEKDFSVKPEDIENELNRMRERHAELVVVEEGTAEKGDTVIIDYEGFIDGEAFEGGKGERHNLVLGSGSFIPGFEDQLIGVSKGEEKEIEVTFPERYHSEDLQGKTAVFKVKVHDIKRKVLPELDDEFAKDVSEFETLEEYKQDIERELQEARDRERKAYIENTVVDKAVENAEVEVPEVMIDNEIQQMLREFDNRLRMQGMNLELYYRITGQDEEALKNQMRGDAQRRVLQSLVLDAIAAAEQLTASEDEVEEELKRLSEQFNRPVEELRELFARNDNIEGLKKDVVIRKTVQLLADNCKLVQQAESEAESEAESDAAETSESQA
jgi:trigger factor